MSPTTKTTFLAFGKYWGKRSLTIILLQTIQTRFGYKCKKYRTYGISTIIGDYFGNFYLHTVLKYVGPWKKKYFPLKASKTLVISRALFFFSNFVFTTIKIGLRWNCLRFIFDLYCFWPQSKAKYYYYTFSLIDSL